MLIAKVQDNQVIELEDYRVLFPNTSFPSTGPNAEFLAANSCMTVTVFKPYNSFTEKLVAVNPYIEDNQVFTVAVEPLTEEEIAARDESAKAKIKAQAMQLLTDTDWTQMPDVTLFNKQEFTDYRTVVRAIALNPPVTVTEWPTKPEEVWEEPVVITPLEQAIEGAPV